MITNPFNPSFGKRPSHFFGRQDITRSIVSAIDDENSPWRTTLVTGIRGSGKTALLSDIRINLENSDAVAIYVVPNESILENVLVQLYRQLPKSITGALPELKNFSVNFGVSVGFGKDRDKPYFTETFYYQFLELLDIYKKHKKHIVFLVDEAQKHTAEMRIFVTTYQELIIKEYPVNMVMAGLPSVISDILNDDVLTFLRRAKQVELENVELVIVDYEFKKLFLSVNASLTEETVVKAACATYGYPYLIQLVGYYLWENMPGDQINILDNVLINSKTELFRNVHKLIYAGLSAQDREFVNAMSEDGDISTVAEIGGRLKMKKNLVSVYRERLISAGVVKSAGHGLLCFNYPYMKEFLSQYI